VSPAESLALAGATMPDGQKYEDWLKDKEGRKESDQSRALPLSKVRRTRNMRTSENCVKAKFVEFHFHDVPE
jgi:hypothetical protein